MADVNIKINGKDYTVPAGSTILTAARMAGIEIPTPGSVHIQAVQRRIHCSRC